MQDVYVTQPLSPAWLAQAVGGVLHPPVAPITDLVWDSRMVYPGAAFVALPGAKVHGREFALQALQKGASLVITDQDHPGSLQVANPYQALLDLGAALRKRFGGTVIGVGGSSGKTTTKECLAQGLAWPAPPGNLNNAPGLAQFFLKLQPATGCVVELGIDRLGEMAQLIGLSQPHVGVITSLGAEHLEGLGSIQQAIAEESLLLHHTSLRLASVQAAPWLNVPGLQTYGVEQGHFQAREVQMGLEDSRFRFGSHAVWLPYSGYGAVLGAVAALAVAELIGQDVGLAAHRLASLKLPFGRMQRQNLGGRLFINDAYNANPSSVEAGLAYLRHLNPKPWVVLGRMAELGSESERLHLEVASLAQEFAPKLVFVGPYATAQAKLAGGIAFKDPQDLVPFLKQHTQADEVIYLKASRSVGLEKVLEAWDA